ncbi:MAG TPA: ATP-binding protein [Candidatus Methanoperedens sp.]|nr:ATP-binding protein [Candidatus Methanoperedens sp.]
MKLGAPVRILLIEDNPADAELLEIRLRESLRDPFTLTLAGTLAEGLGRLGGSGFDVALLDLSLPDSSGLESIAPLREAAPFLPIVVFTGVEEERFGPGAIDHGAQDYLAKRQTNGWMVARAIRYAILRQKADEEVRRANAELERRVAERTEQLRRLASEVLLAEQRERRRLAEMLHDHLQQLLVSAKLQVGAAATRTRSAGMRASLLAVEEQLGGAVEAARSLTADISPHVLYASGLPAALRWLGRRVQEEHGLKVDVRADDGAEPQDEGCRIQLFQSVRELLFNVIKHAGVAEARVVLERIDEGRIRLSVRDQGRGFSKRSRPRTTGDFGLFSIQERLTQMGGSMQVRSAPGRGTRVTLVAPG